MSAKQRNQKQINEIMNRNGKMTTELMDLMIESTNKYESYLQDILSIAVHDNFPTYNTTFVVSTNNDNSNNADGNKRGLSPTQLLDKNSVVDQSLHYLKTVYNDNSCNLESTYDSDDKDNNRRDNDFVKYVDSVRLKRGYKNIYDLLVTCPPFNFSKI